MVNIQALLQQTTNALKFLGATLALTGYKWPDTTLVEKGASYDYIVVGAGTAGCIIANRLAEDEKVQVLLVEAGGDPPIESELSGLYPLLSHSIHDWSFKAVYDPQIAQCSLKKAIELPAGKVLGGSSSIHHSFHTRGHPKDYNDWADIINDDSWNFENMLPYLKKPENLVDKEILESINGDLYGKDGYVILTKEHEPVNKRYLDAFDEIGRKSVVDTNGRKILGYAEPVLYISKYGVRQSSAEAYLRRNQNKANLRLMKNTEVTRIIFDDNKNAIGVIARNDTGEFELFATKEVIICAGTLNTPKLLMLSGIGPKESLEKLDIEVISNLPVGKNLQDHLGVVLIHKMGFSNVTKYPRDPRKYPAPVIVGYETLNKSQDVPDYQTINLVFPQDSEEILQLNTAIFYLNDDIGKVFYAASCGHEVFATALCLLHPKSRGTVELKSKNYTEDPLINLNALSNAQDLIDTARYLKNFIRIQKSTFFRSVGAKIVIPAIGCDCKYNSLEFWKCYARKLIYSYAHYSSTCSLGSVVDTNLKVIGVGRLRVADASVIPKITSANTNSPVMAIAEKAADLIKGHKSHL